MSSKDTAFYRNNKAVLIDFNVKKISSDSGILLSEKIERKHHVIKYISDFIIDNRHTSYIKHSVYKLLMQRTFLMMQGYEDANDVNLLKEDPIIQDVLNGTLGSQPTTSRFENSIDKHQIYTILDVFFYKIGTK